MTRILPPALEQPVEQAVPLEEALALQTAFDQPLRGFSFHGGSAAGQALEKAEYKNCVFTNCRFTGAALSGAWFCDVVFQNCDLSGARLLDATFQRVRMQGCKLSGANFGGAFLSDTVIEDCVAPSAVFSEAALKSVLFLRADLRGAFFGDIRRRSQFRFEHCHLEQAEFLRTSLNGQDLTTCEIAGAAFADGTELRGAKVTALQACELAKLLGVVIEG